MRKVVGEMQACSASTGVRIVIRFVRIGEETNWQTSSDEFAKVGTPHSHDACEMVGDVSH